MRRFSLEKFKMSKTYMIILGLTATLWFLIRVIPKPSRAKYPCMQAAAPLMSTFIIYLLGVSASVFSFKKFKQSFSSSKYVVASLFFVVAVFSFSLTILSDNKEAIAFALEEVNSDFPVASNAPIGEAQGLYPGRVVWVQNDEATNREFNPQRNSGNFMYADENTNEDVVHEMLSYSLMKYTETANGADAWDAIFKSFNNSKGRGETGYAAGEKIAIKINLTNQCCWDEERADATPQLLNALLHELTVNAGVAQQDIIMGDPYRQFRQEYKNIVKSKYPDVVYVDGRGGDGIVQTTPSSEAVLFFAGPDDDGLMPESTLPQHYIDAKYMINVPVLKSHNEGGITLIAKNHQGSFLETDESPDGQYAVRMHYSLPANSRGTGNYRHTVDYMGHEHTGGKGLLYIIDGIWGGESWEGLIKQFYTYPFNYDYPNSIFIGQDPVALESVCFDVLFNEYANSDNKDDYPVRYKYEIADYLQQMASSDYWPEGITYDPEGDGTPLGSLGVFEHWNDPYNMQYSRNLGTGNGIELLYENLNEPGQTQNDTVFVKMSTSPVTVDAQANEACWATAEWNYINQVWMPYGAEMEEGDFEGKFKVSWDEDYLYMFFEIVDDSLSDDFSNPLDHWWDDDCLEVFIDENRSKGEHTNNNNAFAYHVSLFFDAIDLSPSGNGINYKDHVIVDMDTVGENTYHWEMAFKIYDETYDNNNPEASRVQLKPNKRMGLAVAYCDNDETNGRENFIGSMVVAPEHNNSMYQNADHFGYFVLVDPDTPNNKPVVEPHTYTITENPANGASLGTIVASDADGDKLFYSVLESDLSAAIAINEGTGELSVANSIYFDYEERTSLQLMVQVSDGIDFAQATTTIYIEDDANENEITVEDQVFSVDENSEIGTFVGTIVASDLHGNNLTFTELSGDELNIFVVEESTGNIVVNRKSVLDYEEIQSVEMQIAVSDNLVTANASITVNINDVNEVGLNQVESNAFVLYPNPTNGMFNITSLDKERNIQLVEVYNTNGALLFTKNIKTESMSNLLAIDISNEEPGIYFLLIHTNDQVFVEKVNKR